MANIGDIVKCIDPLNMDLLTMNKIYTIFEIVIDNNNTYYKLEEIMEIDSDHNYRGNRFVTPTPEEIKQYKLEKTADKYNL